MEQNNFNDFKEAIKDRIRESGIEDILENLVGTLDIGDWDLRTYYHGTHLFALNVKGKGFGNYDSFNKEGRAENIGVSSEKYLDNNFKHNTDFFETWADEFQNDFAIQLNAGGRSGGWWGFEPDDISSSFDYCFTFNDEKLKALYDKYATTLFNDASEFDGDISFYEIGEEVYDEASPEELDELIKFSSSFREKLEEFANSVNKESDFMETDEYNDEEFESYF